MSLRDVHGMFECIWDVFDWCASQYSVQISPHIAAPALLSGSHSNGNVACKLWYMTLPEMTVLHMQESVPVYILQLACPNQPAECPNLHGLNHPA